MTLLRALSIALLLVASAVLWQSSPASAMSDCQTNIITQSVTCTYVLPGGEGSVTVSCVPHPEYGCPTVVCDDQYIPDDSIHLQGLTWANGGIPVPTELGGTVDAIIAAVGPSLGPPPEGYTPPEPYAKLPGGLYSETGRWYECNTQSLVCSGDWQADTCPSGNLIPLNTEFRWGPVGPPIDIAGLLEEATEGLELPEPQIATAPPLDARMFVQIPAWFWVDESYWGEDRASAETSPGGRLTVRVMGEPAFAEIDPGDGGAPAPCPDGGRKFRPTLDPETGSSCIHIYEHTPGFTGLDAFDAEMTVAFELTWEMEFAGQAPRERGSIGTAYRSTTQPVEVTEIQALVLE